MRAFAALALLLTLAPSARAQKVLVLRDDDQPGTNLLAAALTNAGMQVTQSGVPSHQYAGNPSPMGQDVVVILSGTGAAARNTDMPGAGQQAIFNFVKGGGGLVNTEWSAFQVAQGRWKTLAPLVLLQRSNGTSGFVEYTVAPAFETHPLWAGLPKSFSFATASNVGVVIPNPGVVRVATSKLAGDAVALRDLVGEGRVVQLSTAGNYSPQTWIDTNLQKLVANACKWASASRVNMPPVASPGGPYTVDEGGQVQLKGTCTDPNGDTLTLSWDLDGDGMFGDATGDTATFNAAMRDGPSMVTVSLRCTDTGGLTNVKGAMVTVSNVAPKFTSMPPTKASEGVNYTYQATWTDPYPNDKDECALVAGPMGMTVKPDCSLAWLPSYDQARAGQVMVTISVTDKDGGSDKQSWQLLVALIDTDMDGLPDTWEKLYFGDLSQGPGGDKDDDGRPNLKEYQDATDPTKYDGPTAPAPVMPAKGARTGSNPQLTVMNAMAPQNNALTYEFVVYSDVALTTVIEFVPGVAEGGGGQTTHTVKAKLPENKHMWWRVRARDPYVAGPWSATSSFFVDAQRDPPSACTISWPSDGAKVKATHPTLIANNARSPDELALTYEFEVYADMALTQKVEAMAGVPEGMGGQTSYFVAKELNAYSWYWWRCRATDEKALAGPWSPVPKFQVFPSNPQPSQPTIEFPRDGARVNTVTPTFVFGGSIDLDKEPISYQCDVDVTDTFDSVAKQTVVGVAPDPMLKGTWTPMPLAENKRHFLRCRARDPSGSSTWAQVNFLVDVKNDPPSVPTLTNPSAGGMAAGPVVVFTWANSVDPEEDPIRYDVEVFRDAGLSDGAGMASGGDGAVGVTIAGLKPGRYYWRARAVDALNAASAYAMPNEFSVGAWQVPRELLAGAGCACAVGRGGSGLSAWGWGGLLIVLLLRRRRG